MPIARVLVVLAFALVLGVPFAFRPEAAKVPAGAESLVIITPHREHIRIEFARAFSEWHQERYGTPVVIDWRQPGGTTEIRRQLQSQYTAAVAEGLIAPDGKTAPGSMPYDLIFGGGSFEHDQVRNGVPGPPGPDGKPVIVPMSEPVDFSDAQLKEWYGDDPKVGAQPLFDPHKYWFGAAVSGFGIAYNRDVLARLGLPEPKSWTDLTDHRYSGWLALADPRQSGSVATTYDSILSNYGWDKGWRILRAMAANAHMFSASSAKVIIDMAQGEEAAAVAIDFYGRYESQALLAPGQAASQSRVGYVDPAGEVSIDPDPISLLRGAPHPELAKQFIEFVMSERGQAVWQLPAKGEQASSAELGPRFFEIRRLPIRRSMYKDHFDRFIDKVNPFDIASKELPRGWRSMIGPIFGASAIDVMSEMRSAWNAIGAARDAGDTAFAEELESLFFAMPMHTLPDGRQTPFNEANYKEIAADWKKPGRADTLNIQYTNFFRDNYEEITRRARAHRG